MAGTPEASIEPYDDSRRSSIVGRKLDEFVDYIKTGGEQQPISETDPEVVTSVVE